MPIPSLCFRLHRKTLLKMQMDELIEFLQKTLAEDFFYEDDFVIENALRENLQELRSGRLHTAGPPPDAELPQKPFGLVDISQQEKNVRNVYLHNTETTICNCFVCTIKGILEDYLTILFKRNDC